MTEEKYEDMIADERAQLDYEREIAEIVERAKDNKKRLTQEEFDKLPEWKKEKLNDMANDILAEIKKYQREKEGE